MKRSTCIWLWSAVCATVGGALAWMGRNGMNPDGISYIDMADAAVKGDSSALVSSYWSPAYPALIAIWLRIVRPPPAAEFTAVHLLNFLIFLVVIWAFTRLISRWSDAVLVSMGFSTFLVLMMGLIRLRLVTPDLLVAGFVLLAATLCFRIFEPGCGARPYVSLGVVLGLGSYAKAPVFPAGLILLGLLFLWPGDPGRRKKTLFALLSFLLAAAPLIALQSHRAGKLTIGESGHLNYLWHINGLQKYTGWTGPAPNGPAPNGRPLHPPRVLSAHPLALEFATPVGGTFPLWFDPAYWYDGASIRFGVGQFDAIRNTWDEDRKMLRSMSTLITGALLLFVLLVWQGKVPRVSGANLCLLIWSSSVCGMFLLVHIEGRYVAGFLTVFWVIVFERLGSAMEPRIRNAVYGLAMLAILIQIGGYLRWADQKPVREGDAKYLELGDALRQEGIQRGDGLAIVGRWEDSKVSAAHYIGANVIAVIPDVDGFWGMNTADRDRLTSELARIGSKALVASPPPGAALPAGWRDVAGFRILRVP
jgi:hypothetical protein